MQYNDAEKVLATVETEFDDTEVSLVSRPAGDETDPERARTYIVGVTIEQPVTGDDLDKLIEIAKDVGASVSVTSAGQILIVQIGD